MPALTGIRAVAAFMVCLFHYNPIRHFRNVEGWKHYAFSFINELHIGVTIFFVLSGFLICYRYYGTASSITRQWFGRYMMNRVARIYPMYFLLTLLTFTLVEINPTRYESSLSTIGHAPIAERSGAFFLNITLLKGFFDDYKGSGISQGWSLTVEECFYIAAPFFLLSIQRSWRAWILLPFCTLLLMVGLWLSIGRLNFHGLFGNLIFMLNYTFFGRCLEFFAGMALGAVVLRQQRQRPSAAAPATIWFTVAGIALILVCLMVMASISGPDNSKDTLAGIAINNLALPVAVASLFYGLITEQTWLRRLLSTSLFDLLGKSSYIFYLIHMGVINILLKNYFFHNPLLQFLLLNIISILLYKFVETPLHSWLKPRKAASTTLVS